MSFQNFRDPSTVHLVTASDPHHEHTQSGVLDAGDDAVIAYPVLPVFPRQDHNSNRAGGSKIPSQPVFFQRLDEILEALGEIDSSHLDRHSSRIATGAAIPSGRRMRTTGGRSPVEARGASRPIRGSWIASPPTFVFSLFCMTAWPRWTTRAASERPSQALRWAISGSTGSATTASLPASRTARCASSS